MSIYGRGGKRVSECFRAEEDIHPSQVWKFSLLDRACLSMVIRGVWIFDGELDVGAMKAGFRKLLGYYPHLSGRMKDPTGIALTNEGVPLTVVDRSDLSVRDVYRMENLTKHFSDAIKINRVKRGIDAPLSVRITRLRDGFALGIQCAHGCMDGHGFYAMVDNWGRIYRGEEFEKPVLDRSLLPSPGSFSKKEMMQLAMDSGWKKVSLFSLATRVLPKFILSVASKRSGPFHISDDLLNKLKEGISSRTGCYCSANVAISAFLSGMFMRLCGHTQKTWCTQVTMVDCRSRLAQLPTAFVGNASVVVSTPPFPGDASVENVAGIISRTLSPVLKTPSRELEKAVVLTLNALWYRLPVVPFDIAGMYSRKPTVFQVNNLSRFPIYEVDFGSGKPVLAIPPDLPNPILIWPAP
ncbi:MAG: hypothetical protein HPY68_10545, partial [Candidatus Atribacteria bacterium]|nr:hypothetical protein [Candidatus Atribacteria bacterium]